MPNGIFKKQARYDGKTFKGGDPAFVEDCDLQGLLDAGLFIVDDAPTPELMADEAEAQEAGAPPVAKSFPNLPPQPKKKVGNTSED